MSDLIQATKDFRFVLDNPQNVVAEKITALREQNEALMAALKLIATSSASVSQGEYCRGIARAAIKKVKP
jgi:hypothetical protein